jgi:aminoglycoside phosphotransferase family enzyme
MNSKDACVDLARKVAWLSEPNSSKSARVESIETHQSWVFLTDTLAFKLKKPVRTPHLDYSTVELRRRYCDEEVRLNRRLAPDVYLGVRGLRATEGGFELGSRLFQPHEPCTDDMDDWLVTMRRLPRERALDVQIEQGSVVENDVVRAADLLTDFYASASRVAIQGRDYIGRLKAEVVRYRHALDDSCFSQWNSGLNRITTYQFGFLDSAAGLIEARARSGHIVDAHGDLRPEHVFLLPEPRVIDCLEFDAELRVYDPASELSFLDLECRRLDAPGVGEIFLNVYERRSGDACPRPLLEFYQSHHACMRAVVALWHLEDPAVSDSAKWVRKAKAYLGLAHDIAMATPLAVKDHARCKREVHDE